MVDEVGSDVDQSRLPHPPRPAANVAGDSHREVVVRVHVLDDASLAIGLDLLEQGAGPGVVGPVAAEAPRARQKLVHRFRQLPARHGPIIV